MIDVRLSGKWEIQRHLLEWSNQLSHRWSMHYYNLTHWHPQIYTYLPTSQESKSENHKMTTSFEEIPTLDLSLASHPSTLPLLLSSLRHALVDVGFLYISNHGVPSSVIADLVDNALPCLFNGMSDEAKKAVALENSPHFLGYSGVGSENTGGKVDLREQFEFATELTAVWREGNGEGLPLYERLRGPNQVGFLFVISIWLSCFSIFPFYATYAVDVSPAISHYTEMHTAV